MNKASGGDGIPVELFQILEDDAVKVLHSICQQIWQMLLLLLLLLSRFSRVRLCATPYTAAHQVLVNSKSKLHFTEQTVKFRKVNDSPRDTLQASLSSEWNPAVLLQRRTQMPQGASLSAGPGQGSDHDCR